MWPAAIVWLVVMIGTFYVLIWRPQQRRMAAIRALQADLREGDEVVTTSGVFGRVVALEDDVVRLEIAPGTVIRLARGAVGQRLGDDTGPVEETG